MMSLPVRRYYGLSVWFPDVIKHLQADDYASRVKFHNDERIEDFTFNFTLENQIHKNGVFINDRSVCLYFHIKDRIRHFICWIHLIISIITYHWVFLTSLEINRPLFCCAFMIPWSFWIILRRIIINNNNNTFLKPSIVDIHTKYLTIQTFFLTIASYEYWYF